MTLNTGDCHTLLGGKTAQGRSGEKHVAVFGEGLVYLEEMKAKLNIDAQATSQFSSTSCTQD